MSGLQVGSGDEFERDRRARSVLGEGGGTVPNLEATDENYLRSRPFSKFKTNSVIFQIVAYRGVTQILNGGTHPIRVLHVGLWFT